MRLRLIVVVLGLVAAGVVILVVRDDRGTARRASTSGGQSRWALTRHQALPAALAERRFVALGAGDGFVGDEQGRPDTARVTPLLVPGGARVHGHLVGGPTAWGRDRFAVVLVRRLRGRGRSQARTRLVAVSGRSGHRELRSVVVSDARSIEPTAFAISPRGDIAVAWHALPACGLLASCRPKAGLLVAVRDAGHTSFGVPVQLAARTVGDDPAGADHAGAALAFNARGDLLAAYVGDNSRVQARSRPAGRQFGPARSIGHNSGATYLTAAMTSAGRVLVAWTTQDGGIETQLPLKTRARYGSTISGHWGRVQLLDVGRRRGNYGYDELRVDNPDPRLAMAPDGSAVLTWAQIDGVHAATSGPDGSFARSTLITTDPRTVPGIAAGERGRAFVAWIAHGQLFSRQRAANTEQLATAELVPANPTASDINLGFDTAGRPAVTWTNPARRELVTATRR